MGRMFCQNQRPACFSILFRQQEEMLPTYYKESIAATSYCPYRYGSEVIMCKIRTARFVKLIISQTSDGGHEDIDDSEEEAERGARRPSSLALPVNVMSLADAESLTMPLVQVIVLTADLGCVNCRNRVCNVFSRLDAATGSMLVHASEKKVTLMSRAAAAKGSRRHVNSFQPYCSPRKLVKKIFTFFKLL